MTWYGIAGLVIVLVLATILWYWLYRDWDGPAHCMGCGKCDKTGVCILTGKPLRQGKATKKS